MDGLDSVNAVLQDFKRAGILSLSTISEPVTRH